MGIDYSNDCMYVCEAYYILLYWCIFTLRDCTRQQAPYGSGSFSSVLPCTNRVRQLYAMNLFLTMYVSGTSILNTSYTLNIAGFTFWHRKSTAKCEYLCFTVGITTLQ